MARTAVQMPHRLPVLEFGALLHAAFPSLRAAVSLEDGAFQSERVTARALACSGLVALLGLPLLMLASVALGAPLAPPAAIALGYLAIAYALSSRRPRSAAALNALVLAGLVAWPLSLVLSGEEISRAGLAAALLAPFFAAAPAVAHLAIAPRGDPRASAALRNAACLDRLAPAEAVLLVRPDGALLAATRAARARLRLPAGAADSDVGRCFALVDRPKLADAIARCGASPIELALQPMPGRDSDQPGCTAEISDTGDGAVSVRLRSVAIEAPVLFAGAAVQCASAPSGGGAVSDVGQVVAFGVRHVESKLSAKQVLLASAVEEDVFLRCEERLGRRIVVLMIESAIKLSGTGDVLHLTARALKSVVLLRIANTRGNAQAGCEPSAETRAALAALRQAVEDASGTLLAEDTPAEMRLSIRLDRAVPATDGPAKIKGTRLQ
ncbi:MAG: hypothetical protein ACRED5_17390 [Propylenella sp.]